MNNRLQMSDLLKLGKRFALPALAAYLLHIGVWISVFVMVQPIMAFLSKSINCFLEQFYTGNGRIVETDWMITYTATEGVEALVAICFGVLVGAWVLRRQKKKALA